MSLRDIFVSFMSRSEVADDIGDTETGLHDISAIHEGAKLSPGAILALWCSNQETVMLRIVIVVALGLIAAVSTSAAIAVAPSQGVAQKSKVSAS
jgi:hypothetical protein